MLEGDSLLDMLHRHGVDLRDALWVLARVHELGKNLGAHTDRRDRRLAEARRALDATSGGPAEIERAEKALATAEAERASIEARASATVS